MQGEAIVWLAAKKEVKLPLLFLFQWKGESKRNDTHSIHL